MNIKKILVLCTIIALFGFNLKAEKILVTVSVSGGIISANTHDDPFTGTKITTIKCGILLTECFHYTVEREVGAGVINPINPMLPGWAAEIYTPTLLATGIVQNHYINNLFDPNGAIYLEHVIILN